MTEAVETAAEATETGPTIAEIAEQVFGADAPAIPEAATEPEPAKVEPPKPDPASEKVAARLTVALRAEERAARSRAELAAAKAAVEAKEAEVTEKLKTFEAFTAAKLSPSKALELLGLTPKEFLESLATEHEPAAVAARAVQGTTAEVAKLQAKIDAMEAAAAKREDDAKRREADSLYNEATQQFISHVDAAPDKYPHLIAEYTPSELASLAQRTVDAHAGPYREKFGEFPDDEVIAEFLEDQAKARAETLAERRARVGQKAQVPSEGKTPGDLQVAQPATGPSPRTLTSRTASEKATAQKPWSQEWADEESLRILHAALKTG
jgi:hypothetical protein